MGFNIGAAVGGLVAGVGTGMVEDAKSNRDQMLLAMKFANERALQAEKIKSEEGIAAGHDTTRVTTAKTGADARTAAAQTGADATRDSATIHAGAQVQAAGIGAAATTGAARIRNEGTLAVQTARDTAEGARQDKKLTSDQTIATGHDTARTGAATIGGEARTGAATISGQTQRDVQTQRDTAADARIPVLQAAERDKLIAVHHAEALDASLKRQEVSPQEMNAISTAMKDSTDRDGKVDNGRVATALQAGGYDSAASKFARAQFDAERTEAATKALEEERKNTGGIFGESAKTLDARVAKRMAEFDKTHGVRPDVIPRAGTAPAAPLPGTAGGLMTPRAADGAPLPADEPSPPEAAAAPQMGLRAERTMVAAPTEEALTAAGAPPYSAGGPGLGMRTKTFDMAPGTPAAPPGKINPAAVIAAARQAIANGADRAATIAVMKQNGVEPPPDF